MNNLQNAGLIKSTMSYGAMLGGIIVLFSFILFITNTMPVGIVLPIIIFIISLAIYFAGIFISTKRIRDHLLGGNTTYGQGLIIGMLVSLFAAIITSFYSYIQNQFIDPTYMSRVIEAQKNWMIHFMNGKVPDETIEETIAKIDETLKEYNPVRSLFQGIIGSTFMGSLISLITSAILKKKPNPFEGTQTVQ